MTVVQPEADTTSLTDLFPYEDNASDPNLRRHLIRGEENDALWEDGMTAQDVVDTARVLGAELTAVCGHKFVPKHNPANHPPCEPCLDIAANIFGGA